MLSVFADSPTFTKFIKDVENSLPLYPFAFRNKFHWEQEHQDAFKKLLFVVLLNLLYPKIWQNAA